MTGPLNVLHDTDDVHRLLRRVETARLARDLGVSEKAADERSAIPELRLAATAALAEVLADAQVDDLLRQLAAEPDAIAVPLQVKDAFQKWTGYLYALLDVGNAPSVDDLFLFATAGLFARQPTEVRALLRRLDVREAVRSARLGATDLPWDERVRFNISIALLFLIRQHSRSDIAQAGDAIRRVAVDQKQIEKSWLASRAHAHRDSATLLGLYHLAKATERVAEFLLSGTVDTGRQQLSDFGPELRRLLIRAEEYLLLGLDGETRFWLNGVTVGLWRLRADSIWIAGRGISERLDALLRELAVGERERNIYSLLPSQQEAIRQSLLDPARVAVVLQMPTSAGKTLLAEFSIIQAFEAYKDVTRVVFIAPTRALVTQTFRTLTEDLRPLGIDVAAASSAVEEDPFEMNLLLNSGGVLVVTPEKCDLLLKTHPEWFKGLRLVIVDEAHLLHDSARGVKLELLLATIRREHAQARLLLLTPFIDNASQIATWLGGPRGLPVTVQWRPARLLLGLCQIGGPKASRALTLEWTDPFKIGPAPETITVPVDVALTSVQSARNRTVFLIDKLKNLGTCLALCSSSRVEAERVAVSVAKDRDEKKAGELSAGLRVAIALARDEYGTASALAHCLERGVAFHHSALSPMLRYLIEDQVRAKCLDVVAATTTLAQGMNFPVAVVVVNSVHKPYGGGNLTPAEFWNIAGRAGRVGLVDKGLVIFAGRNHEEHFERYSAQLSDTVRSALLTVLRQASASNSLKEAYRIHEELRPFLQYLAHAVATLAPGEANAMLEELLQASLANTQVASGVDAQAMRLVARRYMDAISGKGTSYLKVADTTGLGSFSFDELFARIGEDAVLRAGPAGLLERKAEGLTHLVEALRWLPELDLAIGLGEGDMSASAVAQVVQGWVEGKRIVDLASSFPGKTEADRIRDAASYVYGTVTQTISWGAHAYMKGWMMQNRAASETLTPAQEMLPAYIQHGVNSPEAAVASLLTVPRQVAEGFAAEFRDRYGELRPEKSGVFREFIELAGVESWGAAMGRSKLASSVNPEDLRTVWRKMSGLDPS